jgi:hypothetical protein
MLAPNSRTLRTPPRRGTTDPHGRLRLDGPSGEGPAVERVLLLAFAPVHKRVFGLAIASAAALCMAAITIVAQLRDPGHALGLGILSVYFHGYRVSWPGVLVGAAWGALVGFVAGWFAAFCRNLVFGIWLIYIRARVAFSGTRDFLDHL